ncbi:MAG TPA: diguanylate cyclase [Solimonas sp.]|nr:diguanylate cyclase [Solimonas sp.]
MEQAREAVLTNAEAARLLACPPERLALLPLVPRLHGEAGPTYSASEVQQLGAVCHPQLHHHAVQFFRDENFLCDVIADYLGEGLRAGAPLIMIARATRLELVRRRLEQDGHPVAEAIAAGQCLMLDAHEALSRFMVDGRPDPARFAALVSPLIEHGLSAWPQARLRAYGEMVDILWSQGQCQAALALEALWNERAREQPFSLLCAYHMDNFRQSEDEGGFAQICDSHSDVAAMEGCVHDGSAEARRRELARLEQRVYALERELGQLQPNPEVHAPHEPAIPPMGGLAPAVLPVPAQALGAEFTLLVVDDDPADRRLTLEALRSLHALRPRVLEAPGVEEALQLIEAERPDLCFCDFRLSGANSGLDLLLSARSRGHFLPFVAVTGHGSEEEVAASLLDAGFQDIVLKQDLRSSNLHRVIRNARIRGLNARKLMDLSRVDELTGVLNRRGYMERLETERSRCERARLMMSVLYLDVNNFKQINDRHGHRIGDDTLRTLVAVILPLLRKGDAIGRLGGDEFSIALPGAGRPAAEHIARRLRSRLMRSPIRAAEGEIVASVSIGIHTVQQAGSITASEFLARSDASMFLDKQRLRVA